MTHLYIATRSDAPDIVKIGRSNDPCRRCEGLSTSHCFTVSTAFVFHGYGRLEAAVHKALDDKRVLGGTGREWFRVSAVEAFAAVTHALEASEHNRRRPSPVPQHKLSRIEATCGLARRTAYDYKEPYGYASIRLLLAGKCDDD
jgi:hypothetical protein